MTNSQVVTRILKPAVWVLGLAPLAWLVFRGLTGRLDADPVKDITHFTGRTILAILFVTLSITPLRRLTGFNPLIRLRRPIGLFAFFYAVIHLLIYFVFDRGLVFAELGEDIAKRPYITVGFTAWMILLALAVTSPRAMVRRLGRRWQTLHRFIYAVVGLGMLHFAWAQKQDLYPVWQFGSLLGLVLMLRLATLRDTSRERRAAGIGSRL